jgi:hypothetical protein
VGEHIICRKFHRLSKVSTKVNYEYEVVGVKENTYELRQLCEEDTFLILKKVVTEKFISAYASTCHSFQGLSVKNAITIFDWKNWYCSRNWIWTAVTRARDLSKVYFYDNNDIGSPLGKAQFEEYARKKIEGYTSQDKEAGRYEGINYATVDDIKKMYGKVCSQCNCDFWFNESSPTCPFNVSITT